MERISAIIVKGTWNRNDTIKFTATLGYYPIENGERGFFVKHDIIESGVTEPVEEDMEEEFFNNKYQGKAEIISAVID